MVGSEVCLPDADVETYVDDLGLDTDTKVDANMVMIQGRRNSSNNRCSQLCQKPLDCTVLDEKLNRLINIAQELRIRMYGREVAEEWPISRTPPEVKQEYLDRSNARWAAMEEEDSDDDNDSDQLDKSALDFPKSHSAHLMTPVQSDRDTSLSSLSNRNSPPCEEIPASGQTRRGKKRDLEEVHDTSTTPSKQKRVVHFFRKRQASRNTDATRGQDVGCTSEPADPSPPP